MTEITVRAETNVLGMTVGEQETTEDTPFIRAVVKGGRLSIVDSTGADGAAFTPAGPQVPKPRRGASSPAAAEAELAADPVLDAPLVTVRPPEHDDAA